ncbi:hypothetical protein [Catalinimonas alkaloidigena]|nr:hypothetical protein [Catalinimonas alkaloidigena]
MATFFGVPTLLLAQSTTVAGFEVDANVEAASAADWFRGTVTAGVLDETNGASVAATLKNARNAQQRNQPFSVGQATDHAGMDAFFYRDYISAQNATDATIFRNGSNKNGDAPASWSVGTGSVPQKNDLVDVMAHLRRQGDQLWFVGGAATRSADGTAHIDFEFYQQAIHVNATGFVSQGTDGGHTAFRFGPDGRIVQAGDLILSADKERGGSDLQLSIRVWVAPSQLPGGSLEAYNALANAAFHFTGAFQAGQGSGLYGYAEVTFTAAQAVGSMNDQEVSAGPWGTLEGEKAAWRSTYVPHQFVEVGADLSQLGWIAAQAHVQCGQPLGYVVVKTRTSHQFTAELKDFTEPVPFGKGTSLQLTTQPQTLTCRTTQVPLRANASEEGIDLSEASYRWEGPAGFVSQAHEPIATQPGVYNVTVTLPGGCSASASLEVTQETEAPRLQVTAQPVSCFGAVDGSVSLTVEGGQAPYQIQWAHGTSLTGLAAGTYRVTVTDAKGCEASAETTITQPEALRLTADVSGNGCAPEHRAALYATGGTAPYTFLWPDGTTASTRDDLLPGTYAVQVTDQGGCSVATTVRVEAEPTFQVKAHASSAGCGAGGGAITLETTGGTAPYTYAWSTGAQTASLENVSSGAYQVTVTDATGCQASAEAVVVSGEPLRVSFTTQAPGCQAAGAIDATVTGGSGHYTYQWSNGASSEDLTGLAAGTYVLTVRDESGCEAVTEVTLAAPPPAEVQTYLYYSSCESGQFAVDVYAMAATEGTFTYRWVEDATQTTFATSQQVFGLQPGDYTVFMTNAEGCTSQKTVHIAPPVPLTATIQMNGNCAGGATQLVAEATGGIGPYTYRWTHNGSSATTLDGVAPGVYTVSVYDQRDCEARAQVEVKPMEPLRLSFATTEPTCATGRGDIDLRLTGGSGIYQYTWSNGATTQDLTSVAPGVYQVTVKDAGGCSVTGSVTLKAPPALELFHDVTYAPCEAGFAADVLVVAFGGSGSFTYTWRNTATGATAIGQTLHLTEPGTYVVTATDTQGCRIEEQLTISAPEPLTVQLQTSGGCSGAERTLEAYPQGGIGPYAYEWTLNGESQGTDQHLYGAVVGQYEVTITDSRGCRTTEQITVAPAGAPLDATAEVVPASCTGDPGKAVVTVTGGVAPYNYMWTDTGSMEASRDGLMAGTYEVMIWDAQGCIITLSVDVPEATATPCLLSSTASASAEFTVQTVTASVGDAAQLTWTLTSTDGQWTIVEGQGTPTLTYQTGTLGSVATLSLMAVTAEGCTQTCSLQLTVEETPVDDPTDDPSDDNPDDETDDSTDEGGSDDPDSGTDDGTGDDSGNEGSDEDSSDDPDADTGDDDTSDGGTEDPGTGDEDPDNDPDAGDGTSGETPGDDDSGSDEGDGEGTPEDDNHDGTDLDQGGGDGSDGNPGDNGAETDEGSEDEPDQEEGVPAVPCVVEVGGECFTFRFLGYTTNADGTTTYTVEAVNHCKNAVSYVAVGIGNGQVVDLPATFEGDLGRYDVELTGWNGNPGFPSVKFTPRGNDTFKNNTDVFEVTVSGFDPEAPLQLEGHAGRYTETYTIDLTACAQEQPVASRKVEIGTEVDVYPNPFHTETTLAFVATHTGEATLELFDLYGHKIKTIYAGPVEKGNQYSFTLTSEGLQEHSFLYRLTTDTEVRTGRLLRIY